MQNKKFHLETRVIHAGQTTDPVTGSVMPVIYPSAIYQQKQMGKAQEYVYSRSGNPMRTVYEQCVADLENGEYGFDIVLHSVTKYLNGHSDVIGGVVVIGDNIKLADKLRFLQCRIGAVPSPYNCYAVVRGIKTLALRMERHAANAGELAVWLKEQPQIAEVFYPGLPEHPGHELAKKQMTNFGGMLSVLIKGDFAATKKFLEACQIFCLAGSLGGVESLIGHPATMSHSSIPENVRQQIGITDNLVRLSVGIENIEDLKADLKQALHNSMNNEK